MGPKEIFQALRRFNDTRGQRNPQVGDLPSHVVVDIVPMTATKTGRRRLFIEPIALGAALAHDGFGAALILDVLGVDEDAIVNDYLLTNNYLSIDKEIARLSAQLTDHSGAAVSEEVLRPMLEVRPEYIRACFEEIRRRYNSKEHFYESALRLDNVKVRQLKDRYLH